MSSRSKLALALATAAALTFLTAPIAQTAGAAELAAALPQIVATSLPPAAGG